MRVTRPFTRRWGHVHAHVQVTGVGELARGGIPWELRNLPSSNAGPVFKGMDPSDPSTWVRPWNPQPGMVARLNYDGAQLQARTPYGLQRGSQHRGARGSA